jgi:hypothetical protein
LFGNKERPDFPQKQAAARGKAEKPLPYSGIAGKAGLVFCRKHGLFVFKRPQLK